MSNSASLSFVAGQPSWQIANRSVEVCLTALGGHMAPVIFDRAGRRIQPFCIAPWAEERNTANEEPITAVLRGDFFCMPFGMSGKPWRGEKHPTHGETANGRWRLVEIKRGRRETRLQVAMDTTVRPGRVEKTITLIEGHQAVYCQHVISGASGPMNLGHHATLQFPPTAGSGIISTSPFVHGQVYPDELENPALGGYSCLNPGATFRSLHCVRMANGGVADLSRYPARPGFEDLVQIIADPKLPFAWTAVTFHKEGYVWFALKDPRVLTGTVMWISNGGRHYHPWNGRNRCVMGLEEVTSYFHAGLAASAGPNPLSRAGYTTCHKLRANRPLVVNVIMGLAFTPRGFDAVRAIRPTADGVMLISKSGKQTVAPLDLAFLEA